MKLETFLALTFSFVLGSLIAKALIVVVWINTEYECEMQRHLNTFTVTERELRRDRSLILMTTRDGRTVGLLRSTVLACTMVES